MPLNCKLKMVKTVNLMLKNFFNKKSAGPGIRQTWFDFQSHHLLAHDFGQVFYLLYLPECSPKYRDSGILSRMGFNSGNWVITKPLEELEERKSESALPFRSVVISVVQSQQFPPAAAIRRLQEATTDHHSGILCRSGTSDGQGEHRLTSLPSLLEKKIGFWAHLPSESYISISLLTQRTLEGAYRMWLLEFWSLRHRGKPRRR